MRVIIAEKPKVAGKIANALGKAKRKAYKRRVSTYEVDGSVVLPAVGHVYRLVTDVKGYGYPVFDIHWEEAYKRDKKAYYTKPYIEAFKSYAKKADSVVVATDYDNEGSLIGYNIARFIFPELPVERMKFSALTQGELRKAFENRGEFDYGNAIAGETRHMVDWFYGINLSRALMQAIKKAGRFRIMSIGRVQGPTLALTASKEIEIREFEPQDYWLLGMVLKGTHFHLKEGKVFEEERAKELYKRMGDEARITNVEKKEENFYPPPPFDLTTLQVEAHRLFKISPAKTLQLAQNLYEASLISYPRTSSQKLPPTIGFKRILGELAKHSKGYSGFAEKLLEKSKLWPRQGKKDDPAHPAIYPTGLKPEKLEGDELKLYNLIASRFVALFMEPMVKEISHITADNNGLEFQADGSRILSKGWYEAVESFQKVEEKEIAEFREGEVVNVEKKEKKKEKTKPPKRYSEASLIRELEKRGLGTKATRAVIISTLLLRKYIFKGPGGIHVTDLGMSVYNILGKHVPEILSEELTREIERELEEIAEKPTKQKEVLDKTKKLLTEICNKFKEEEEEIGKEFVEALGQMREKAIAHAKGKK